ncbi:sulfur carrier protein ThiS [Telmatobacter bradus]|uniref:sulfur carrier protein ThiS n=1 Tax=Telmatobacter bradus TaxID=474953 RepID=UPI003B43BC66
MITLNGNSMDDADHLSLAELVVREHFPLNRIAVACNGEIVPRTEYSGKQLADGDVVDVVWMVSGG